MSKIYQEELSRYVEEHDFIDFGEFGEGESEESIERVESDLGFSLPPSYRWWLKNYYGGSIEEKEITCLNNIKKVYVQQQAFTKDPKRLYILTEGHHEAYFDLNSTDKDGEYTIFEDFDGNSSTYNNFLYFLISLIESEI